MCEGRITAELNRHELDSTSIMTAASTVKKHKKEDEAS